MNRAVGFIVVAVIAGIGGSGCGDNFGPPPLTEDQLIARLRGLDGVTVKRGTLPPSTQVPPNVSYYILQFTQPVDHEHPEAGTFQQQVSLLHRNDVAPTPMIVTTSGYSDAWGNRQGELTQMLDANQVSIEHRYYGTSRPDPIDWTKLTIQQMAADEHAVIQALKSIYHGAFLTTGSSKGGMTAVFHRRFYPDDVDGTIAYVAPLTFGTDDPRYPQQFNKIGTPECREKVRLASRAMLAHRDHMLALAQAQADNDVPKHVYSRVQLGPSVEAAIAGVEWGFWQMWGIADCGNVPAPTASDEELFAFLDEVSPVTDYDDAQVRYYEPYVYQTYAQLGFPDDTVDYLAPDMIYTEEDYEGELPIPEPDLDSDAMRDIDEWVEADGDRVLFVYGDWDPWFAGRFVQGSGKSMTAILHEGTHRTQLKAIDPFRRDPALAALEAWTGVKPVLARTQQRHVELGAPDSERGARGTEQQRVPPRARTARR
jgi:hypothetical protein